MSHMARRNPSPPDLLAPRDGETAVRPRDGGAPSDLVASRAPRRSPSSTRPASGSLDDRLAKKMQIAGELMKDFPPTDARVRLLYVAIMRRDEALLDGLLAELNKVRPTR